MRRNATCWALAFGLTIFAVAFYGIGLLKDSAVGSPNVAILGPITIRGFSLPVQVASIQARFGPPRQVRDVKHHSPEELARHPFPRVSGDHYWWPQVHLRLEEWRGPDGGQSLTGDQVEVDGKLVLQAGDSEELLESCFGVAPTRLCYPLAGTTRVLKKHLTIHLDPRGRLATFELTRLQAVD